MALQLIKQYLDFRSALIKILDKGEFLFIV